MTRQSSVIHNIADLNSSIDALIMIHCLYWWCVHLAQVDLHGLCSMAPLPLSQGVLLALLQQLSCDLASETQRKIGWMTDVAVAINPTDPMITSHIRPIFEQVYNRLLHQRTLQTTTVAEASSIRLIIHVINSVLMSCK